MDKVLRDPKAIAFFVLPGLLLLLSFVFVPMFMSMYYSLLSWDGFSEPVLTGLTNFQNLFNPDFGTTVMNIGTLTVLTLLIQIPLALILALILSQGYKGFETFRTMYFIPVILSSVVIGLLWKRIYDPNFGLFNGILAFFQGSPVKEAWLGNPDTAMFAASAPIVWQWIGYHMLLLFAALAAVPKDLREAATIDGAGPVRTAWYILIPLIKPVIRICIVLAVIGSMKAFDIIYVLTNGGPGHASELPTTLMVKTIFKSSDYGSGSAIATFIVAACLGLTVLIQKIFKVEELEY